jgi:FixJ family two-component response regulator
MITKDPIIFVVDYDSRVCEALSELILSSLQWRVIAFRSAGEYLDFTRPDSPACLILDVDLPDISGLDLQRKITNHGHPPIVFITGNGDIPSSVRAIKEGAVDFLTKPFRQSDVLEAIQTALNLDRTTRLEQSRQQQLRQRYSCLTMREREVLPLVVGGLLNKQAAAELGISEVTLQIHRSRIIKKMKARSVACLARMAELLQIPMPSVW